MYAIFNLKDLLKDSREKTKLNYPLTNLVITVYTNAIQGWTEQRKQRKDFGGIKTEFILLKYQQADTRVINKIK